jgi:cell division protein FtsL
VTTIAAPPRRARAGAATTTPARAKPRGTGATRPQTARAARAERADRPIAVGRLGAVLAVVTICAVVTAVVFHVVLAQRQMQLDRLNAQIAKEQRTYEQRRLTASLLASPQRIIQEAERLGLVLPPEPAQYLYVPDAPMPKTDDGSTADTIADWSKTKPSLGPQQP